MPPLDEYRKYIEKDAALERRFQPVQVSEPTVEQPSRSSRVCGTVTRRTTVSITDTAIVAAATLADRYINDFLPDKAIDLIDEAGARMRIRRMTAPPDLREFDEKIADAPGEGVRDRRAGLREGGQPPRSREAAGRSAHRARKAMALR